MNTPSSSVSEALDRVRAELAFTRGEPISWAKVGVADLDALLAALSRATEALRPFAEANAVAELDGVSVSIAAGDGCVIASDDDFRKAAAVLAELEGE